MDHCTPRHRVVRSGPRVSRVLWASLLSLTLAACLSGKALALNVPITVSEGLPQGVSGIYRTSEPVTVGIPLPDGTGITSVSQLGLSGASAGQFRALATWSSGNLKWALVDFQTSVPAGGVQTAVSLTDGGGSFGGSSLATDNGSTITVSTGAGQFTILKSNFDMIHQATVGGQSFVQAGGLGVVVRDPAGLQYTSSNDGSSVVSIEENGPVRAVVLAKGSLKNAAGIRLMDYTVRLHFYAGKSYVKTFVSLRNASTLVQVPALLSSAQVDLPVALGAGRSFSFGVQGSSPISRSFSGTETAYLFQAATRLQGPDNSSWTNPPMLKSGSGAWDFSQQGLQVVQGSTTLNQLSNVDAPGAEGWGEIRDASGKGVTFALRWMSLYWPSGIEFDGNGKAQIELFSKRNSLSTISFAWGAWETRELLFDFHSSSGNNTAALYALQYPLLGRAPLGQYAQSGAFYGEQKLVSAQEASNWFASRGGTAPSVDNVPMEAWRYYYWPQGGGSNQVDQGFLNLIDFARTGYGGYYERGEQISLFKSDSAVRHSDGFDYHANPIIPSNGASYNSVTFDFEHPHMISMPIYYWMSGNELMKESVMEFSEWYDVLTNGQLGGFAPQIRLGSGNMRVWSRSLRNLSALEEFTRDPHYQQAVQTMMQQLLDTDDSPPNCTPYGRSRTRGYVWMLHGDCTTERRISDFFTVQIHAEAVWEAYRLFKRNGFARTEDIEDLLLGLADFAYNEFYFEVNGGSALRDYGYQYSTLLDTANNASTNPTYYGSGLFRPISSGRLFEFAYELTGDVKYLDREAKLLKGDVQYVSTRTPSDPKCQAFMYEDLNRGAVGWQAMSGVNVTNNGGGSYTLRWTVPSGASAYRIKYAAHPIIPWLGFDQAARTYAFSPQSYTAWFGAQNLNNEPAVQAPGSSQQFTVTGLDPTTAQYFMVKYRGPSSADTSSPGRVSDLRAR